MSYPVKFVKIITPIALAISLAACGGGDAHFGSNTGGSTNGKNPDDGSGVSGAVGPVSINGKCDPRISGAIHKDAAITTITDAIVKKTDGIVCDTKLTNEELTYLSRFNKITYLSLSGDNLLNLNGMPSFPELKLLYIKNVDNIGFNKETGNTLEDISGISKLTALNELHITGHSIKSLNPLSSLTELKELYITSRKNPGTIVDASPLGNLTNLRTIQLSNTGISDLNFLQNLTNLKGITLADGNIINIDGLQNIVSGISGINLNHNKIKDITLLASMHVDAPISLEHNRIEDASSLIGRYGTINLGYNCIADIAKIAGTNPISFKTQEVDCSVYDDRDPLLMKMGSGSGATFNEGTLSIIIPTLTSGAKTAVTASLVGPTGNLSDREAVVTFSSDCIVSGQSMITGPVTAKSGVATVEYTAKNCLGEDVIKATTKLDGISFSAESTVTVVLPDIGSTEFISSTPNSIGIKGSGSSETSIIRFIIKDKFGNPVNNRQVNFSLDTDAGGMTLDPVSALSNSDGIVTTTVQSGTVPTTVRVLAVVDEEPTIKTQSEGLVVSTGISDQNSFTIATSVHNVEGLDRIDGKATITVSAADAFNNPVPEGTAIYFTPEGGKIEPSCLTDNNGACSVTWTSTNPKPSNGRVTVLATMLGDESFVDKNGNGLLDDTDTYEDLGEAFLDKDEDGIFNNNDVLRDFNSDGQWNAGDNEYNGTLCNPVNSVNLCSTQKSTHARGDIVLIMSGPAENILVSPSVLDASSGYVSASLVVSDRNNQPVPAGSVISLSMIGGGSILSDSSITVLSTTSAHQYNVNISGEAKAGTAVFLHVKVRTPSGVISSKQFPVTLKLLP